jgi:hypothetical protein
LFWGIQFWEVGSATVRYYNPLKNINLDGYWVDVVTSADDKILCQIVVCLWGKARMGSAYDFNLLMYFLALA